MTPNYSGQSALKLAVKSCRDSCDTGRGVKSADELSHETSQLGEQLSWGYVG